MLKLFTKKKNSLTIYLSSLNSVSITFVISFFWQQFLHTNFCSTFSFNVTAIVNSNPLITAFLTQGSCYLLSDTSSNHSCTRYFSLIFPFFVNNTPFGGYPLSLIVTYDMSSVYYGLVPGNKDYLKLYNKMF